MTAVVREGRCRCGITRVRAAGQPLAVTMCHCKDCQRRTGSAFSIHAYFPEAKIAVSGTPKAHGRAADSGRDVTFHFCLDCGSTVFWKAELRPGATGIPVGLFADPGFPPPQRAIFCAEKLPWVSIPEGIEQAIGHGAPAPKPA